MGNDLRQSYRTIAQSVGVSKLDIHLLLNHSLPGVNEGYIPREKLLNDLLLEAATADIRGSVGARRKDRKRFSFALVAISESSHPGRRYPHPACEEKTAETGSAPKDGGVDRDLCFRNRRVGWEPS